MVRAHQALIYWSDEQIARGLPAFDRTVDPAWLPGEDPPTGEGWSLICDFEAPPRVQGSPSRALVQFMVAGAPHDRLGPGTVLQLFERSTQHRARVEILE